MGHSARLAVDDGRSPGTPRDRVLPATRLLAAAITPFLVVAFAVLYPVPTATGRWFAWEINPTMTPMVLGAAYLGGAYFFVQVVRASAWHTVKVGFIPVTLFAATLGVSTVLHWDRFNHDHVAFWLWSGLYFTTPFAVAAVWWRNRREDLGGPAGGPALSRGARLSMGAAGLAALGLGAYLVAAPGRAAAIWPWPITELTGRVMGSVVLLGVAGLGIAADHRHTTARLLLDVARVMIVLILAAAVRAHDEFFTDRPLTWLLGAGLAGVLVGASVLRRQTAGP